MPDKKKIVRASGVKKKVAKLSAKPSAITREREALHQALCEDTFLLIGKSRTPTSADSGNKISLAVALHLAEAIGANESSTRPSPQRLGSNFQHHCRRFLEATFPLLGAVRPGDWKYFEGKSIAQFEQYAHLKAIAAVLREHPSLRASLGGDYFIKPDVVIARGLESDAALNATSHVVDAKSGLLSSIRKSNGGQDILHASVSCKWTIRSDRVQNSRAEALNLIRNRKGKLPHVVAVTAEPLPSRLASLCFGTGDLDCIYHIALDELLIAVEELGYDDALSTLQELVDGRRLKDISDLPLDLAV